MALSKTMTLDTGVVVTYFRVDAVAFRPGTLDITVGVYKRADCASPVARQQISMSSVQYTKAMVDEGRLLEEAYAAIKRFAAAPQVPGVSLNKRYLAGEFTDV